MPAKIINNGTYINRLFSASFQRIALAYNATDDDNASIMSNKKYFLPRAEMKNYNLLIDGRNFFDQSIRKVAIEKDDDYTTGHLLDYAYFKDDYKLIGIDLIKQKSLDTHPRAIQQIVFQGVAGVKLRLYTLK